MSMESQARQRLSDDHHNVGELLQQVLAALDNKDVQTSYAKLDLLWARLAVHIRAEHLHLFPLILSKTSKAQLLIDSLRIDHDFFMRELAGAIAVLRENGEPDLTAIRATVVAVEKRLATHNEIEENHVYHLTNTILTPPEQLELASHTNAELENRPPRFSAEAWANCL